MSNQKVLTIKFVLLIQHVKNNHLQKDFAENDFQKEKKNAILMAYFLDNLGKRYRLIIFRVSLLFTILSKNLKGFFYKVKQNYFFKIINLYAQNEI